VCVLCCVFRPVAHFLLPLLPSACHGFPLPGVAYRVPALRPAAAGVGHRSARRRGGRPRETSLACSSSRPHRQTATSHGWGRGRRAGMECSMCPEVDTPSPQDPQQVEALIAAYAPLVKYLAQRLACRLPTSIGLEDLMSAGVLGLLDAITKY